MTRRTTTPDPVLRLLRAARRRLWWEAILRRVPAAAWLAGLVLLVVGGAATLPGLEPGWSVTAGIVCAAFLTALVPGLAARPSLTEAALHADRTFGTHALLVSALEADRDSEPSPADREVGRRARDAAGALLAERRRLRQPRPLSGAALALIPAFLGLLLLRQASPVDERPTAERRSASVATRASLASGDEDERSLQRLRQTLTVSNDEEPDPSRGERRVRSVAPSAAAPDPGATREEVDEADLQSPGHAAATSGGGAEAGDAKAGAAQVMDARDSGVTPATAATLARQGTAVASAVAPVTEYAGSADPAPGRAPVNAAAAPPKEGTRARLSAAQIAYARRYLESTGDGS